MSVRFLIIDGYNVMHAAGLARANYGPGDLSRQRHVLLAKLAKKLTIEERKRCTVVFDAIDAPANLPGRFKHEEIVVLFPKPGHEADELIELLISQHSASRNLTVVSSDHRLQNAIRRRRGIGVDSDVFLNQLDSQDRQIGPSRQFTSNAKSPEADLDFWTREFEGINTESLAKEALEHANDARSDWDREIEELEKRMQNASDLDEWLDGPPKRVPPPKPKNK